MSFSKIILLLFLHLLIIINSFSSANDNNSVSLIDEALFQQALVGDLENIRLLLSIGANPNTTRGEDSETVLMWASKNGRSGAIALLLSEGAKPNTQDANGYTALMWACKNNDYANVVEILLEGKADIGIQNDDKQTALTIAIENNKFNVAKILLKNSKCTQALSK